MSEEEVLTCCSNGDAITLASKTAAAFVYWDSLQSLGALLLFVCTNPGWLLLRLRSTHGSTKWTSTTLTETQWTECLRKDLTRCVWVPRGGVDEQFSLRFLQAPVVV